jgi:hypothetical protein
VRGGAAGARGQGARSMLGSSGSSWQQYLCCCLLRSSGCAGRLFTCACICPELLEACGLDFQHKQVCIQEFLSQEVKSLIKENDSLNKQNMSKKRKLEEISDENEDLRKNDYERIKEKRKLEHTIVSKEEIIEQLKRENEKTEENLKDAQKAFKTLRNSIGSKK